MSSVPLHPPSPRAILSHPPLLQLSRLHTLVDEVTEAYIAYEFNAAGRRIYDFFWSDFADWYIEASKTRLYSGFRSSSSSSGESSSESGNEGQAKESQGAPADEAQQQAQAVLAYAFDSVLRLLHPFMPFASEQLWQALPHPPSLPSLMLAPWPASGLPRDAQALEEFDDLQALVRAIRNVRAEYSVEPAKKIAATVVAAPTLSPAIQGERDVLALLARVDPASLQITSAQPDAAAASACVHVVAAEGLEAYLPIADMVDVSKELQRLGKQQAKLTADLNSCRSRLSSKKFVDKAPAAVVDGVRKQAEEAEEKLALVNRRLEQLQGMAATTAATSA
ncbi:unnamed protein product [Closterium sp. Yama58-4]|nr:unnamed protein product [Closterium sp. Yama58-4]